MKGNLRKREISKTRASKQMEERITILIVCEGQKTEPNYFNKLKEKYNLSNIEILKNTKPSPSSVVKVAEEKAKEYKLDMNNDVVYCVFDRDEHQDINQAFDRIQAKNFRAILSSRCFEIWYLLHFRYTNHIFSSYNEIKNELKRVLSGYDKEPDDYTIFLSDENIQKATNNAKRLEKAQKEHCSYESEIEFLREICAKNLTFTNIYSILEKMKEIQR